MLVLAADEPASLARNMPPPTVVKIAAQAAKWL
jgi:hypothetical protein